MCCFMSPVQRVYGLYHHFAISEEGTHHHVRYIYLGRGRIYRREERRGEERIYRREERRGEERRGENL